MDFTVQLRVAVKCSLCGRLWDLTGLEVVDAEAHQLSVEHEVEGPCPGCAEPDGPDGGETVAAE